MKAPKWIVDWFVVVLLCVLGFLVAHFASTETLRTLAAVGCAMAAVAVLIVLFGDDKDDRW